MDSYNDDFLEEEKALPEARLYKRNVMDITFSMLDHFRYYRMGGPNLKRELSYACSDMLFLFDILEEKIDRISQKKNKEKFRVLLELMKYETNVDLMTKIPLKKIIRYKSLLIAFLEELGITRIEMVEIDPRRAVLEGI